MIKKQIFFHSDSRGFTLTELLITIIIFVLIIVTVYSTFILSQRAYREKEISAEITQNGRVILERMTREIRQAKEITSEFSEQREYAIDEIIFEDGHISIPYYYIRYFTDSINIRRQIFVYYFSDDPDSYVSWDDEDEWGGSPGGPDSCILESCLDCPVTCKILEDRIIGEYVTELKFWGSDLINIFLTLAKDNKQIDLSTQIFGRNF